VESLKAAQNCTVAKARLEAFLQARAISGVQRLAENRPVNLLESENTAIRELIAPAHSYFA